MEIKPLHPMIQLNTGLKVLDENTTEFLRCQRSVSSAVRGFYLLCHISRLFPMLERQQLSHVPDL